MSMAALILTRRCRLCSSLYKNRPQVGRLFFSSDPPDEERKEEARQKLKSLLAGIKSTSRSKVLDRDPVLAKPAPHRLPKKEKTGQYKGTKEEEAGVDPELIQATKEVAALSKNERFKSRTQSDLLRKLQSMAKEAEGARAANEVAGEEEEEEQEGTNGGKAAMADLFSDLRVEKKSSRSLAAEKKLREEQIKNMSMEQRSFLEKRARMRREKSGAGLDEHQGIELFGAEPLGILQHQPAGQPGEEAAAAVQAQDTALRMWRRCADRELRLLSTPVPRNALEEMILWTEQGKLWHFPVDNEQGLDYSKDPFHQHVFLEHHLEPWCPKVGPVRHFMELVCAGLSKNPYITAQRKKETIMWFKAYFERPKAQEILIHQGLWGEEEQAAQINT